MTERLDRATRRPQPEGRRAAHTHSPGARAPTILIAGVVHYVDRLHGIAGIERARLRGLVSQAARDAPEVVVVGTASPATGAIEVIGELKRHERTGSIPVLHIVAPDSACGACGAEICLPAETGASTLVSAVRLLLRLRQAERHSETAQASQRLLALGRLADVVVHHSSTLLPEIIGRVEAARTLLGEGHPVAVQLLPVVQAAEQAGTLTRQLLRFGRSSQGPARSADIGAVLAELDPLLRIVLGVDLRIEVRAGQGLGLVRVDPAQLEQLLLNLVLNARDAMPGGGRVTIETQDVEVAGGTAPEAPPGRYVMLVVSDEGVGVDERAAGERPGLAWVHQVVQQAGGSVRAFSQPGLGTTFRLYLPCAP
jgi:signal transduction histidine kinase